MGMTPAEISELKSRQWSPDDAKRVLADWRESGETIAEFAKHLGIGRTRLFWWKKALSNPRRRRRVKAASSPRLVPAVLTAVARSPQQALSVMVRATNGVVLEIPSETSPTWVSELVNGLSGKA